MLDFSDSVLNLSKWLTQLIEESKRRKPEKKRKKQNKTKRNVYSCKEDEYKKQKPTCRTNGKIGH